MGLACESGQVADSVDESRHMLTVSQADVMGFEVTGAWSTTTSGAVLGQSSTHSQGASSLSIRPSNSNGYTPVQSVPLSTLSAVSPLLAVDIMMPSQQANPWWYGTLQAYLNCPSRNIYSQFLAQVELTGKPLNVWNTINFPLTNALVTSLLRAGYTDLTITVAVNVQVPTTGVYLLDNLRFVPVPSSQCGAKPDGTSCTDANACTQGDTCRAGACRAGSPVVCPAPDQCHTSSGCNQSTGECAPMVAKDNGTPCNDGNACTQTDTCQAGTCTGSDPVVCSPLSQCHDAGVCDSITGECSNPPKTGEAACIDDLMPKSWGDTCSSLTPMGIHYEALAAGPIADSTLAYLNDASQQPDLPSADNPDLTLRTFAVTLYPSTTPVPSDANQGAMGDCGGIAALGSLAYLGPAYIQSLITDNGDGTYSVTVHDPKGDHRTVRVDSQFLADASGTLQAVGSKNHTATWATVLEKVVMKYIHAFPIVGQMPGIGSEHLTPIFTGSGCSFAFSPGSLTAEELTRALTVSLARGRMVVCGFASSKVLGNVGTYTGHAHSGFVPANTATMISMRNAYGENGLYPSGTDSSTDGILNVPPTSVNPVDGMTVNWASEVDLRILEGVACTSGGGACIPGRTTPYIYP